MGNNIGESKAKLDAIFAGLREFVVMQNANEKAMQKKDERIADLEKQLRAMEKQLRAKDAELASKDGCRRRSTRKRTHDEATQATLTTPTIQTTPTSATTEAATTTPTSDFHPPMKKHTKWKNQYGSGKVVPEIPRWYRGPGKTPRQPASSRCRRLTENQSKGEAEEMGQGDKGGGLRGVRGPRRMTQFQSRKVSL